MGEINACLDALKTCAVSAEYIDWFSAVALIVTIIIGSIGILFAISRLMGRRDWEAFARVELYHTGVAILWVVLIATAATASCSITCVVIDEENPFLAASNYLSSVSLRLQETSENLFDLSKEIRLASALNVGLLDVFSNPWAGCAVIAESYETLAVMLTPFVGSLIFQQYVLIAINNIAFQLLLPVGIILRLIPFTRESGAAIMGLAFALYIVLPLTYVFAAKATSTVIPPISEIGNPGLDCGNPGMVGRIMKNIGNTIPQAVFFPALSMILTIATAKSLSRVFNYDFQELG